MLEYNKEIFGVVQFYADPNFKIEAPETRSENPDNVICPIDFGIYAQYAFLFISFNFFKGDPRRGIKFACRVGKKKGCQKWELLLCGP